MGRFLFSASFGYFVKLFGGYDLALIPAALILAVGVLLWLRIDATEQLIPEALAEARLESRNLPSVNLHNETLPPM